MDGGWWGGRARRLLESNDRHRSPSVAGATVHRLSSTVIHQGANLHPFLGGEDIVDAGHSGHELAVRLGHAAGGDQLLAGALARAERFQHLQRLCAGAGDEATGVHNDDVGVVGVGGGGMALGVEDAVHALAVNGVLGAAQGNKMIFHGL